MQNSWTIGHIVQRYKFLRTHFNPRIIAYARNNGKLAYLSFRLTYTVICVKCKGWVHFECRRLVTALNSATQGKRLRIRGSNRLTSHTTVEHE